jgi:hypothetical protein
MAKKRKRTVRLYTDVNRNLFWTVPFVDAQQVVETPILFSKGLVCKANRGICYECVLARGIQDYADGNPGHFPHDVLHVYVQRSAIYIIDKYAKDRGGAPAHAVRYFHSFGSITHSFDKITKRQFLQQFNGHGFILRLRPAKRGGPKGTERDIGRSRPGKIGVQTMSRGALGRAQEAGLTPLTAMAA